MIETTPDELQTQLDRVKNMSATLRQILGRPNFACVQRPAATGRPNHPENVNS